mgnify:CR=1 FL=1
MTMQKKMLKTAAAACAAALAAVLLAGCGDEASKKTYSPVPFTKHDRCHLCGMVLAHYEGPKARSSSRAQKTHRSCSAAVATPSPTRSSPRTSAGFSPSSSTTSARPPGRRPPTPRSCPRLPAMYVYGHGREGVMGDGTRRLHRKVQGRRLHRKVGAARSTSTRKSPQAP